MPEDVCSHACDGRKDKRDGWTVLVVFGMFLAILTAVLYGDLVNSCRHEKQHKVSFGKTFNAGSQRAHLEGLTPF